MSFLSFYGAEKEQVKAILEIKTFIDQGAIFGRKIKGTREDRNPNSRLAYGFEQMSNFLPAEARYILFAFSLSSSSPDAQVIERLKKICDSYAILLRWEPKTERKKGKEPATYNFDDSVSRLIEWLRNLS